MKGTLWHYLVNFCTVVGALTIAGMMTLFTFLFCDMLGMSKRHYHEDD